jgi:hypothetical protein
MCNSSAFLFSPSVRQTTFTIILSSLGCKGCIWGSKLETVLLQVHYAWLINWVGSLWGKSSLHMWPNWRCTGRSRLYMNWSSRGPLNFWHCWCVASFPDLNRFLKLLSNWKRGLVLSSWNTLSVLLYRVWMCLRFSVVALGCCDWLKFWRANIAKDKVVSAKLLP